MKNWFKIQKELTLVIQLHNKMVARGFVLPEFQQKYVIIWIDPRKFKATGHYGDLTGRK